MMLYKFDRDHDYDLQMSVATWKSKCTKIIYLLINPWSQAHTSTDYIARCVNRSVCKLQYLELGIYRISGSGSGSGQNDTKNRISEPDSDWSFLAVSSPIESVTGRLCTKHDCSLIMRKS